MELALIILLICLALYVIAAFSSRFRAALDTDLSAVGFALVCFTILVVSGTL